MTPQHYTASLSRSQGRPGWSVIFRHPVRRDESTGKPGLRVRRGLGTQDEGEAQALREELNRMLSDRRYWEPAARSEAEVRFDARVVEIFYYGLQAESTPPVDLREAILPLPPQGPGGPPRVLLLGTTGAGKTTLVRQLIGTDSEERFPSTSTAKTTIHDTEIILRQDGPFEAAVSFATIDEVRDHINDCITKGVLSAYRSAPDHEILRQLLNHVGQRMRFSYVLGNGPMAGFDDFADEAEVDTAEETAGPAGGAIDLSETNDILMAAVEGVRELADRHGAQLRSELNASDEVDQRVVDELFEEELDRLLRADEDYQVIGDRFMDEIERRFDLLTVGVLKRNRQGSPVTWEWQTDSRLDFLKEVNRFSSNYAPRFGTLLTPLVTGVRVAGPFRPFWSSDPGPSLVLFDGEGLGHNPRTSASLPTSVTRRVAEVDSVLLVDNATQPMQSTSVAVMRELASSGNASKLVFAFTHFDEVTGDNLPDAVSRARHVLASAENVLSAVGEQLGRFAERVLRKRLDEARFFLAAIHEEVTDESPEGRRTLKQLRKLLDVLLFAPEAGAVSESKPVYDRVHLPLAIKKAAENFHDAWLPVLGLAVKPGADKEHWTRVKALSRRLAIPGWTDEYDTLRPVADLRKQLQDQLWLQIQNPIDWTSAEPSDDEKQEIFNALAQDLSDRVLDLVSRRMRFNRIPEWQKAYFESGTGSSYRRAHIIADDIYEPAAPIPDVTPTPDRNRFLAEVIEVVKRSVDAVGAQLR